MRLAWIYAACLLWGVPVRGQDAQQPAPVDVAPSLKITIPDEPQAVDPSSVMPPSLAKKVTKVFNRTSLKELAAWAKAELQMPVILDSAGLSELKLLSSEQITDELRDEPIFVILDRLELIGLGWYIDDGTLHITSKSRIEKHYNTVQYVVSDLLDAKYDEASLVSVIQEATEGPWDANEPGTGTILMLGDVLFVRQLDSVHREVAALLNALRTHGRRTRLLDLPVHENLRARLDQPVTVELDETPFDEAVQLLGTAAGTSIRIHPSVMATGIRVRQPLTLKIEGQGLRAAIQELGSHLNHDLRGFVSRGILWVATEQLVRDSYSSAVFDVRDLCRDEGEVFALQSAIESQTEGPWYSDQPGTGTLNFPVPGTLVCRQNPEQLDELLKLLEDYRTALRASKPRPRVDEEAEKQKITTYYYRMPTEMANELVRLIPQLIAPDSWLGEKPIGTIRQVASQSETETIAHSPNPAANGVQTPIQTVKSARSVLIIRQTNATHREIETLISQITHGSTPPPVMPSDGQGSGGMGEMGGGMGGGGGFGGGFFRVEQPAAKTPAMNKP